MSLPYWYHKIREGKDVSPPSLCSVCRSLKLTPATFAPDPSHTGCDYSTKRTLLIRPFEQIEGQKNCALCRLIQQAVGLSHPDGVVVEGGLRCELQTSLHRDHGNSGDYLGEVRYRILQLFLKSGKENSESEATIVDILPVDSIKFPGYFIGRRIDSDTINFSLVKGWINNCQRTHRGPCRYFIGRRFREVSPYIRVIDIEEACLTRLPPRCRYTALSYVWGDYRTSKMFVALRKNISSLSGPGSLVPLLDKLPPVVRDALYFVRSIGERYLWVDSVCIVQDDEEEKHHIINKMNLVYGNAFLTLFAATGIDASAGLPGVKPFSRGRQQPIEQIGRELELMIPHSVEDIMTSTWATRGWTYVEWYQESFFSKRKLSFINGRVFYTCRSGSFREDLTRSHSTLQQKYRDVGPADWQPSLPISSFSGYDPVAYRFCFLNYVQVFTKRNLSSDSDILNAFAGITDYLNFEIGLGVFFGIPVSTLGLDILWQPYDFLRRRVGFPSWSWVGWKGPVLMARGEKLTRSGDYARKCYTKDKAWLARLFFIPFYIFDEEDQKFHILASAENKGSKGQRSGPKTPAMVGGVTMPLDSPTPITPRSDPGQLPPIDREKDWSFDPRYEDLSPLLSRIGSAIAPPSIALPRLPHSTTSRLNNQTLLFHTLTARIYISSLDSNGSPCKPAPSIDPVISAIPCVFLYDEMGAVVGLGWLCDEDLHNSLGKKSQELQDNGASGRLQVEVAVLSGPITGNWRHTDYWHVIDYEEEIEDQGASTGSDESDTDDAEDPGDDTTTDSDSDSAAPASEVTQASGPAIIIPDELMDQLPQARPRGDDNPLEANEMKCFGSKYCQVMLLGRPGKGFTEQGSDYPIKERIGLGEIREDLLGDIKGLAWRDVLLR
ncbi:hypothetical protein FGG08_002271 [Glutinoglossum americanum]|uniref:Heterokaryon incompatibility domain-containing protein n=1 Tax=Glutinoglossum americanum TaxID=1670608 RepID=A0A9P8KZC5_9PEZI|nr:hypothetical protein FGG08_002271 [Glutinoglossum americanum]